MRKGFIVITLALAATMLNASFAMSAEEQDTAPAVTEESITEKTSSITAETVVVSATRSEKPYLDVPISIDVVTEKDLRERPVQTLADALRDVPGVQVQDGTMSGIPRISIRGESPSRSLILIDGMKIGEQKSMDGAPLLVDLAFIERIEVVKGPASVLYGSEAIGGVVNIITKKGGDKPVQGTLILGFDSSVNAVTPKASIYGGIGGFGYRVSGSYIDAENRNTPSGDIKGTSFINAATSAYLDYKWDNGLVAFGYDYYKNNNNLPGGDVAVGTRVAHINMDLPKWERETFFGKVELNNLSDYLSAIKLNVYNQNLEKDFFNDIPMAFIPMPPPGGWMRMALDTSNEQNTWGGSLQSEWTLGANNFMVAGIDASIDKLEANGRQLMNLPATATPTLTYDEATQKSIAVFVNDEWTIAPGWTISAGARQTWINSILDESKRNGINNPETDDASDSHAVFSAGIVYSGFENWHLRANFAQGYGFPNLQQLYMGTSHGGSKPTYANADLKPESSNSYEIGARYSDGALLGDVAVYYTQAEDYIRIKSGSAANIFSNVDGANTFGMEARLEYTFQEWGLTPYITGTYMYREFDHGDYKTSQTNDPRLSGNIGLRWEREVKPELWLNADVYGRFASAAKEYNAVTDILTDRVETNPGWGTLNLNFGLRAGAERQFFANIALNNILNKEYAVSNTSLEDPGFNVTAQFGVEF